ncbi:MAG: adenylosuccinate lyase [Candidatus Margulisiibacteriota bacterium]
MIERYTLSPLKEIWSEENKFRKWLDVELAVCEAWAKLKKIPPRSLKNIQTRAQFDIKRINIIESKVDHDVIAFLTSVAEKVGPDSRFIHMGCTSSDIVDTALALLLREAMDVIIADAQEFSRLLKRMAIRYKDTLCIGRTHGVHAEPTTFGLKMALFMAEMERNITRLKEARETISVGKISGAVGTYSNIDPKVEELTCQTLKLKPAPVSTQIIQRDRHAEYLCAMAITGGTLEKLATEIRALQRTEVAEVEEPFKKGQKGSSAMPHKKNPITCERVCGLSRLLRGNAQVALENINLWHERDISHSSAERVILPDSTIVLHYMIKCMHRVMNDLVVFPRNMLMNIDRTGGLIFSQRLLLMLVDKGLTREQAYRMVQADAMKARNSGRNLKLQVLSDQLINKKLSLKEIESAFDIRYYTRNINKIFERMDLFDGRAKAKRKK